jgi:MOSC domain-containing protein YiiM
MSGLHTTELQEGLTHIAGSPRDEGTVEMVVRRPIVDEREVVASAQVELGLGLAGDSWGSRPHPSPDAEITLMNARCIALLAGDADRWALAGDQLYVDLDLGVQNLPPGTRLRIGSALLEVSAKPHSGCSKFSVRFGAEALAFVNSDDGRAMRLRGLNARVVEGGTVRTGDRVTKVRRTA